jgi:hypothetical protein
MSYLKNETLEQAWQAFDAWWSQFSALRSSSRARLHQCRGFSRRRHISLLIQQDLTSPRQVPKPNVAYAHHFIVTL